MYGFLSHLHSFMVTVSQKSSLPQFAKPVLQALMSDTTTVLSGGPKKRKNSRQFGDHLGNPGQYVQEWRTNMSKNKVGDSGSTRDKKNLNRRNFIKRSAAIGVGTAAFGTASTGPTQAQPIAWDYEADVVVLGAGATGLPAAIRARDLGASVIVVEQNFDIGGTMIHSNGNVSLGAGDAIQLRDLAGKKDPGGLITSDPLEPPEAMRDNPDLLFRDQTDWTVVNTGARAAYRYNNREVLRAWCDHVATVRQFLL